MLAARRYGWLVNNVVVGESRTDLELKQKVSSSELIKPAKCKTDLQRL